MTDQELKELIANLARSTAELRASQAKTDAQLAKTDAQLAKTDAQLAKTDLGLTRLEKQLGGIGQSLGDAAEEFFFNSLTANPQIGDVRYDEVFSKVYGGPRGQQQEYDLVLVNGNAVAIIEVKHKANSDTIKQVQKQLRLYRQHFSDHKKFKLYGGIAGMSVSDSVSAAAQKKGLFVLKGKGEVCEVNAQHMQVF